jgi:hypothetical protein
MAIIFLCQIHHKPNLQDNWSRNSLLKTPIFSEIMPVDRFLEILSSICLQDKNNMNDSQDQLKHVRTFMELCNLRFQAAFNLGTMVSVDESLLLWKGHHGLKRYIPSKADRWGFKFYVLADSKTGYISKVLPDEGQAMDDGAIATRFPALSKSGRIVMMLMQDYLNRGHLLGLLTTHYFSPFSI